MPTFRIFARVEGYVEAGCMEAPSLDEALARLRRREFHHASTYEPREAIDLLEATYTDYDVEEMNEPAVDLFGDFFDDPASSKDQIP